MDPKTHAALAQAEEILTAKGGRVNIYVGNLPYGITDESLSEAFTEFGEVSAARVITDRFSGRSRGFGFVEMPNDEQASAAIQAMNGKDMEGRPLTVNEARPREDRGPSRF